MAQRDLRTRVKDALQAVAGAAEVPRTSRSTLLALSELTRRVAAEPYERGLDLTAYELRVFSQNGEDGVIAEILARCGTGRGRFVEFGAEFGVETNCSVLCDVRGFGGLYIEGAPASYARLERRYAARDDVTTLRSLVTPENIESLLRTAGVPSEFDVLSMDVDGAEYWIWEALESYAPRVVVAEYNAALDPGRRLVQPRDAGPWDRTDFVGASIGALRSLAEAKGYRHVHCELGGNNAFFVRADLPGRWPERVLLRGPNFFLLGGAHLPDRSGREYVELDA